uniref:Uncharacterized protein n=1 Tax=uncultured prokaryote TaxID=198431 RepID=A0A0H5QK36_9ZZZZ|nr:hypothetical protein [uncultured prokaryote]
MRIRYDFAGIANKDSGLEVYVERKDGSSVRVYSVMIPWGELCDMSTLHHIDKAVRRELIERWSTSPFKDDDIPGIG